MKKIISTFLAFVMVIFAIEAQPVFASVEEPIDITVSDFTLKVTDSGSGTLSVELVSTKNLPEFGSGSGVMSVMNSSGVDASGYFTLNSITTDNTKYLQDMTAVVADKSWGASAKDYSNGDTIPVGTWVKYAYTVSNTIPDGTYTFTMTFGDDCGNVYFNAYSIAEKSVTGDYKVGSEPEFTDISKSDFSLKATKGEGNALKVELISSKALPAFGSASGVMSVKNSSGADASSYFSLNSIATDTTKYLQDMTAVVADKSWGASAKDYTNGDSIPAGTWVTYNYTVSESITSGDYTFTMTFGEDCGDVGFNAYSVCNQAVTIKYTVGSTPATYTLTVSSGTGSGNYAAGAQVDIRANDAPTGKKFDKWTTSNGGTFASATSASTKFTMPAADVTVTATYIDDTTPGGDADKKIVLNGTYDSKEKTITVMASVECPVGSFLNGVFFALDYDQSKLAYKANSAVYKNGAKDNGAGSKPVVDSMNGYICCDTYFVPEVVTSNATTEIVSLVFELKSGVAVKSLDDTSFTVCDNEQFLHDSGRYESSGGAFISMAADEATPPEEYKLALNEIEVVNKCVPEVIMYTYSINAKFYGSEADGAKQAVATFVSKDDPNTKYEFYAKYVKTKNGGTFEIEIPVGEYDVTFSKASHTKYIVNGFDTEKTVIPDSVVLYVGDTDEDGYINGRDNATVTYSMKTGTGDEDFDESADFNEDGYINATDRNQISHNYSKRNTTIDATPIA